GYRRLLKFAITHKALIVGVALAFMIGSASVLSVMGMEFMMEMDQGYVSVSITTPRGSVLEETSGTVDTVLARLDGIEEIEDISVTVGGGGLLSAGGSSNSASISIKLIPKLQRKPIVEVEEDIRTAIGAVVGAECTVSAGSSMGAGMMSGGTVDMNIYSEDQEILRQTSEDIVSLMSTLPALRNASSSMEESYPQSRVVIDRNKASSYGLQASSVANTVSMAVSGRTVTQYKVAGDEIDVVMRYDVDRLQYLSDLENLTLMTPAGTSVPLSEVASIISDQGLSSITKSNRKQYVTVSAEIAGSTLSEVTADIDRLLADYTFLGDSSYEYTGSFISMTDSFESLLLALILGFVLVYMVIASQFESLAYPGTILFSIPIAWTAGLCGLFFMGASVNVASFIGLILLMGIVVNNGIVLVDYINIRRRAGLSAFDAILEAGPIRLRPILMTTITTVVGLLPMVFSSGEGSEMQAPMGAVIAVGLTLSTLVTLVLIPVLYLILHNIRKAINNRRKSPVADL
ncbi:MAG: efflux RND transporter permease subunit, partial [Clostridiales bacterium]|nr:efflux RND transporter permease subunit [Clostridiales bacterium]